VARDAVAAARAAAGERNIALVVQDESCGVCREAPFPLAF